MKLSDEFVKSQHCLSSDHDEFLKMAFLEHVNRHVTKRLYPRLELVSKELNHLAAILHVYAGGLNFMK